MEELALITKFIFVTLFLLFLISAFFVYVFILFKKRLEDLDLEKELETQKNNLANLEAILSAQERERKTIADDLHDEVGATLSLVQKNLSYIQKNQNATAPFNAELTQSIELVNYSIQAIRGISKELIPNNVIQLGLIKSIEHQLNFVGKTTFESYQFHSEINRDFELEQSRSIEIYRIYMELINNIVKHDDAKNLSVNCSIKEDTFILSITHDGKGFNNEDYQSFLVKSQGLGLKSVANRLQRMNGSIQFSSKDNQAQINVNVPLGDTKTL